MTDLSLIGGVGTDRIESSTPVARRVAGEPGSSAPSQTLTRPSDRVELSERARLLSKLAALPDVRSDLVDRVRREIANGTYESDAKIDGAVQGVLDELDLHG